MVSLKPRSHIGGNFYDLTLKHDQSNRGIADNLDVKMMLLGRAAWVVNVKSLSHAFENYGTSHSSLYEA